jgi:MFS family permease
MLGYVLLYFFRSLVPVFLGTLIMLCGYLSGMAVFGAMLRDHTPENKAGMFQGQRIIGQVLIPGMIGPAIGAAVLQNAETVLNSDGTTSFLPNANIFLAAFGAAAVLWLMFIPLLRSTKK